MFPLPQALLIKLGVYAGMAAAVIFAGWMIIHTIRADAVKDIKAADAVASASAKAEGARVNAATAEVDLHASEAATAHQQALAASAAVIKSKVSKHVHVPPPVQGKPDRPGCVSYGLVRQHDAAALGVDPDTLPLPTGTSDDACSPVTDADLAGAITDNYAAARANAQELTDLQARDRAQVDATTPKQ